MKYMEVLSKSLILVFLAALVILPANAALVPGGAVGPINPITGFPNWYQDQNGLAFELMEAADGFGISAAVDPANPFSQQIGFGAEGFYWSADAIIPHPSVPGGRILLVLAMEAAFAGEAAVDGEQSVFGRLRMTFDVPEPGTYTVFHPYGQQTFIIDAVGPGPEIRNAGSDIGCFAILGIASCNPNIPPGNPVNFSVALQSEIGPFLTWDTFNLDPALTDPALVNPANPGKRYVGNPLVEHAIKGSPIGRNFFRIEGPNIGGPGINFVQTNLFTVTGRIAVIDTVPPVIVSVRPALVLLGSTNVILNADITDNLGIRGVTVDLGPFGNNLTATLNGAQEVPPTTSTATGSGTFTIDTAANTLSFNISFTGLSGAPTDAHIHGPAPPGANANILFSLTPLGLTSPITGTWNYPEASEADILAGNTYVNIHTLLFPGGEIRGQILPTSNVQNMVLTAGNRTSGTWGVVIGNVTRAGAFNLPIAATDGSNTTTLIHTLTVSNVPVVTAAPNIVIVNNTTIVTVTVTQGALAVGNATVDLTGAPLPAPLTGTTDAAGNATFSVSPTAQGTITVTANSPTFPNPATTTIIASPTGIIRGDANGNNVLDVVDTLFTLQAVSGLRTLTPLQTLAADVNANGALDVADGLFIAQAVAGLRTL